MEYVYVLVDPRVTDPILRIRYVGWTRKTIEYRLKKHLVSARRKRKTHRDSWITSLVGAGFEPGIEVYKQVPDGRGQAVEVNAIALLQLLGAPLTNLTKGGDGIVGYVHSKETIAKFVAARPKQHSPEHRARIAASNRKAWAEGRRKKRAAPAHLWTPEVRAKISARLRGRPVAPERRARIAQTLTGRTQSAETIARRVAKLKGRKDSDATRAKKSAAKRRWWRAQPSDNMDLF